MSSLVSERLCLPPKIRPYSLHAPHQVCARDAQATSDLGVVPGRHGRPTGFSVHGWRTPKHFQSAGLTSVEAAGDLVRHIALARSGISLTPGTCSGPPQCPRVQQSQQNAPEVPRQANFLATAACSMEEGDVRRDSFWKGGGLRRPVRQRGMDYLRALLVTPYD